MTDEQIMNIVRYSTFGSNAIPASEWCAFARALEAARATPADQEPDCKCAATVGVPHAETCPVTQWVREQFRKSGESAYAQPPQNAADHIVDANKKVSTYALEMLVAAGHVSRAKADEALSIAAKIPGIGDAQSVRDAAPAIPDGWRFYSADFSVNAKDERCPGHVMLIRDPDGKAAWLSLTDEEREVIDLHVQGKGLTFGAALSDSCEAALKSAPPQKPVSDEVMP